MSIEETTIQIKQEVKKRLDCLKLHKRESYNSVIERLLTEDIENETLSTSTIAHIEQSLNEIKEGRYVSFEEVKRKAQKSGRKANRS